MKRGLNILGLLVVAALAAWQFQAARRGMPTPTTVKGAGTQTLHVVTVKPELRAIEHTIEVSGTTASDRKTVVSARQFAIVEQVAVRVGDSVSKGQVLFELRNPDGQSQLQSARAAVRIARAQKARTVAGRLAKLHEIDTQIELARSGVMIAKGKVRLAELGRDLSNQTADSDSTRATAAIKTAQAGVDQARLSSKLAIDSSKRLERLFAQGGVPRVDVESARTQSEIALAQLHAAEAGLLQAQAAARPANEGAPIRRLVNAEELEAARSGLSQAEKGLVSAVEARGRYDAVAKAEIQAADEGIKQAVAGEQQLTSNADGLHVLSPSDGLILEVNAHKGENVQPGVPLLTIAAASSDSVELTIPWGAPDIAVGTKVHIGMADSNAKPYIATIASITPAVGDGRSAVVIARFDATRNLPSGIAVRGKIDSRLKPAVLTVPVSAVMGDAGTPSVWILRDGRLKSTKVAIGASDGKVIELLNGVSVSDEIVIDPPLDIIDGATAVVDRRD